MIFLGYFAVVIQGVCLCGKDIFKKPSEEGL